MKSVTTTAVLVAVAVVATLMGVVSAATDANTQIQAVQGLIGRVLGANRVSVSNSSSTCTSPLTHPSSPSKQVSQFDLSIAAASSSGKDAFELSGGGDGKPVAIAATSGASSPPPVYTTIRTKPH